MPSRKAAGPSGGGDVGERMAGEGLAPDHGEDADDGRDDRRDRADDGRGVDRAAREEAGLEEEVHAASGRRQGRVVGDVAATSAPGSATTSTRPCSLSTSTWCP